MDLYKVLEVRKNASIKTIKKAYHEKALKFHPDKNPNNPNLDVKKFHEIQAAYDILSNEEERLKYDNLNKDDSLNIHLIFSTLLSKVDSIANFNKIKCQFTNILNNPKNIINIMGLIKKDNISFDDVLDILSNLKTNNLLSTETDSEYQLDVIKAKLDIELTINTNMKDVYNDKAQEIIFMRKVNGKEVKETVNVPLIGDQIIFEGLGDIVDDKTGNLIINTEITNNMKYKKRGNDLIIRFEISLYQLFNGLVFSFIHLDDKEITIKIDECFKYNFDGIKFKYTVPSKGVPLSDGIRGDLIIYFVLSKDTNFDEKLLRFFG